MDSECYQILCEIENKLNSYEDYYYEELKEKGILDEIFNKSDIAIELEYEVKKFFNIIGCEKYKNRPIYRKLVLYQQEIIGIYNIYGNLLSIYFNKPGICDSFSLFMLELANIYNIPKYKDMTQFEMLTLINDNIDISIKRNREEILPRNEKYATDKYAKYNYNDINMQNRDQLYRYAEIKTYEEECERLKNIPGAVVRHVARYDGDGFGYDVYSYDPTTGIEKIIEVKSSNFEWVNTNRSGDRVTAELSLNEFETLYKTRNQPNVDYWVYKYYYDAKNDELLIYKLRYDKENDILIDIYGNTYFLSPVIIYPKDVPLEEQKKIYGSIGAYVCLQNNYNKCLKKGL